MATSPFTGWKVKAPPLRRFCTLAWTSDSWPDKGAGVWEIMGYEKIGTRYEEILLRRVMPAIPGGETGNTLTIWREVHERGGLRVWAKIVEDPECNAETGTGG